MIKTIGHKNGVTKFCSMLYLGSHKHLALRRMVFLDERILIQDRACQTVIVYPLMWLIVRNFSMIGLNKIKKSERFQ